MYKQVVIIVNLSYVSHLKTMEGLILTPYLCVYLCECLFAPKSFPSQCHVSFDITSLSLFVLENQLYKHVL